jgi:geranylgeranyl pyrophosphate synthase
MDSAGKDPIKRVPENRADRERIRAAIFAKAASLDKTRGLAKREIETHARAVLADLGMAEDYLGWTMVALGTAFWREQVVAIPTDRRLLLLPHCMRNEEVCQAKYNELGLLCEDCGACLLSEWRAMAQRKGYKVLIAEGSPIVLKLILEGHTDAVLGIGCLNSLEKALDKIMLVGLPAMAVPLFACTCSNTATDEDWAIEMIDTPYESGAMRTRTRTQVHLLRSAAKMFDPDELERLAPRLRGGPRLAATNGEGLAGLDPIAATEAVAYDFLAAGGKHFRPFITLAAYDAMTGGHGSGSEGAGVVAQIPDAVKRVALAIEVFHKASLVHDDIEDDDAFRYGHPALHRKWGVPTAINVGDYLIGLGYRLVAAEGGTFSADAVADILAGLSRAHTRLCEGQGAELAWKEAPSRQLTPLDALKIYALKTAPAFEAALYAGVRLATDASELREPAARFARHLGVAFQILNDLEDWDEHQPNGRSAAGDVLAGRPTVLLALAMEALDTADRERLQSLIADPDANHETVAQVRQLYNRAGVFRKASDLITKHAQRARTVADQVTPPELSRLLHYFVDAIVKR